MHGYIIMYQVRKNPKACKMRKKRLAFRKKLGSVSSYCKIRVLTKHVVIQDMPHPSHTHCKTQSNSEPCPPNAQQILLWMPVGFNQALMCSTFVEDARIYNGMDQNTNKLDPKPYKESNVLILARETRALAVSRQKRSTFHSYLYSNVVPQR